MKISIVVPVYNTEKYLDKCLRSIQKQTYQNIEIIVVNDGSPDNSQQIISNYVNHDSRFICVNKENGGLASARNKGIEKATGDFICFVDSDDWVKETFISDFVDCINKNPNTDIVISKNYIYDSILSKYVIRNNLEWDFFSFEGEDKELYVELKHIGPGYKCDLKEKFEDTIMCVWKNIYRTRIIKDNNLQFINEREIMLEDYYFNLQAYHYANKICVISKCNYVYVLVDGSLSKKYRPNYLKMSLKLHELTQLFISQNVYMNRDKAYIRAQNFMAQNLVEIVINRTCCKEKGLLDLIKNICNDSYTSKILHKTKGIRLPFYYSILLFFMRNRLCILSLLYAKTTRKMYVLYRLYMARGKRSVSEI